MAGFVLDDSEIYRSRFSDVCSRCQHLTLDPKANPPVCKAFPKGIPQEIWTGRNDHTQPYEGDKGIQFEARRL